MDEAIIDINRERVSNRLGETDFGLTSLNFN